MSVSARSTIVRARLVIGMASMTSRSSALRQRVVCTVNPACHSRLRGAVTSMRLEPERSSPHSRPAERWLSTALGPQTKTAASSWPRNVSPV